MLSFAEILKDGLFQDALMAAVFLAVTCATLGYFVVVRRIVFVGMTVAQAGSAGIALSFFLAPVAGRYLSAEPFHGFWQRWGGDLCSLVLVLLAVTFMAKVQRYALVAEEAVIGFCYAVLGGMSLLFVSQSGQGLAELRQLLQGDILYITPGHVKVIGTVAAVTVILVGLAWRPLNYISFDRETAAAAGLRLSFWDGFFYAVLGIAVSTSIRFGGLLLVFTFLVAPAAGGLLVCRSSLRAALFEVLLAAASTTLGMLLAFRWDLPASPLIVCIACVMTGGCGIFAVLRKN